MVLLLRVCPCHGMLTRPRRTLPGWMSAGISSGSTGRISNFGVQRWTQAWDALHHYFVSQLFFFFFWTWNSKSYPADDATLGHFLACSLSLVALSRTRTVLPHGQLARSPCSQQLTVKLRFCSDIGKSHLFWPFISNKGADVFNNVSFFFLFLTV